MRMLVKTVLGSIQEAAMSGRLRSVPSGKHEKTGTRPVYSLKCRHQSSKSSQPPISFQRLTMPQNSSAVFSVS
ncbi:hypothetical protein SAMN05444064_10263 [Pseudomonas syringae]|nr:hypothetical protein SAMN05444514_102346 [Pseudomonas syringae]SFL50691.1 hypothetical protein SAMN05444064_10263 [Pseudomonas syringae]